jgi:tRNA (cytidine/uridine-2'-O-)-methyltransferase
VFNVVLYEPEIPPNTGNIMRLVANVGAILHLVEPLGFRLTDRQLRRAGLDYREKQRTIVHKSLDECKRTLTGLRWYAVSTRGRTPHDRPSYRAGDVLLFGPETRGLPAEILADYPAGNVIRIPMVPSSRSLNLANAVGIVVYEAWRQQRFAGAFNP